MIPKEALIAIRLRLESIKRDVLRRQLMEPAPYQKRLSTDQVSKPRKLLLVFQRAAITTVQIGNLVRLKILEGQACADVERGLIQVGDEEVGFGGVGNRQSQSCPRPVRVECPLVVPGTKHPEHLPEIGRASCRERGRLSVGEWSVKV